ncbi:hypothetical protein GJ744_012256 [Endocarpon pusillum]|uniref:Uncharacterized protein n=1 Tax=Endocarpon pusillum TaxID=364733 RepID=A0A8H7AJ67_9EURO|nr:hypothetical protein GJ744_012256 [Endocarpon pusillum]
MQIRDAFISPPFHNFILVIFSILYADSRELDQAEGMYERALQAKEKALGAD